MSGEDKPGFPLTKLPRDAPVAPPLVRDGCWPSSYTPSSCYHSSAPFSIQASVTGFVHTRAIALACQSVLWQLGTKLIGRSGPGIKEPRAQQQLLQRQT